MDRALAVVTAGALFAFVGVGTVRLMEAGAAHRAPAAEMRTALTTAPDLAGFYAARGFRPLWLDGGRPRPEAHRLVARLSAAAEDGLDPAAYRPETLAALLNGPTDSTARARLELALSRAFAAYVNDLREPVAAARPSFVDPGYRATPTTPAAVLEEAAAAPSLGAHLEAVRHVNPVYDQMRAALAAYRAGPGRELAHERLILANLERARALPPPTGPRYILVNTATATLTVYDHGRPVLSMPVIVGKESQPTPFMAGLARFALFNPYWNVPEDLARDSIAPKVLDRGLGYFTDYGYEALSDWSDAAKPLAPTAIDWRGVAQGRLSLRVRQRPGPENMMGRVKFMMPNPLGIYLHDTPDKALFRKPTRRWSSGCIRLSDAPALARVLFGQRFTGMPPPGPERRVDLSEPIPVYIAYLTAAPTEDGGVAFASDAYGRDPVLLASLSRRAVDNGQPTRVRASLTSAVPTAPRSPS